MVRFETGCTCNITLRHLVSEGIVLGKVVKLFKRAVVRTVENLYKKLQMPGGLAYYNLLTEEY